MKGRSSKYCSQAYEDLDNPRWSYLVDFQRRVGIRKDELKHLRGSDFKMDESNNPCVLVRCGKGGKRQLQRLMPSDVLFVKSYFDKVTDDEYVFSRDLFKNRLNLHSLRAKHSRDYYDYLVNRIKSEKGYAEKLEVEIRLRWNKYNIDAKTHKPKPFPTGQIRVITSCEERTENSQSRKICQRNI